MNFTEKYRPLNTLSWPLINNILLIQGKQLGDCLLTTPVIDQLQRAQPHIRFDVVCQSASAQIFEALETVDAVFTIPTSMLSFGRLCWTLKTTRRYDLVLDFHGSRHSKILTWLFYGTFVSGTANRRFLRYTHRTPEVITPRHTVDRNLDVLRRLGLDLSSTSNVRIDFITRSNNVSKKKFRVRNNAPVVVIHCVAKWMFKTPNPSVWIKLIKAIHVEFPKLHVVLTGGNSELERLFCEEISAQTTTRNLCGQTSIVELGQLITACDYFIGVDTFAAHIAAAADIPGVVLFGPSCEKTWGPYNAPKIRVLSDERKVCRPCNVDGCGGSKRSACLDELMDHDSTIVSNVVEELGQMVRE